MATLQISGPYLAHYPGIMAELERLHIAPETLRYVDVTMKEHVAYSLTEATKTKKNFQAVAVLHSNERIPLTLTELIYDDSAVLPTHDGDLDTYDYNHAIVVLDPLDIDASVAISGGHGHYEIDAVFLDARQALSLLEWLRQQEPTLKKKKTRGNDASE